MLSLGQGPGRRRLASEGANSSGPNDVDLWRQEQQRKVSRMTGGELPEIRTLNGDTEKFLPVIL